MEKQPTHSCTFVRKPFYKWWFNKCSDCSQRGLWTPMAKCSGCKHYNHRTCTLPEHNACADATRRDLAQGRSAQSTSQEVVYRCRGPTVIIRPGQDIELQMCRCPNVSLANITLLNLLGPHQKSLWADDGEDELENDQPQVVDKTGRLHAARKILTGLFTRRHPLLDGPAFTEACIEGVASTTEDVPTLTRHYEAIGETSADPVEDTDVVNWENSVNVAPRHPLDSGALEQISNFNASEIARRPETGCKRADSRVHRGGNVSRK